MKREPIAIYEKEIGEYVFRDLIKYYGFCIDKPLQDAIAATVFDFLADIGLLGEIEEDED